MDTWSRAGALALLVHLWTGGAARADELAPLPPVVVPLPPEEAAPEAPSRRDPSAAVTVVDVRERRGEARVASELVATAPGVLLQDRGGLLQTKTLSIRGASANGVLVLLDGVPVNGAGGSVDLSRLPLAIVDRFEVLRGGGARHGSGALGGVLNVVTRRPEEGGSASGALTGGSFGTAIGHAAATGPLLGGSGLVLAHGGRSDGAFPFASDDRPNVEGDAPSLRRRENNDVAQGGGLLRYRRALGAATLDLSTEIEIDERGLAGTEQAPTPDARMSARRVLSSARASMPAGPGTVFARAFAKSDESAVGAILDRAALSQHERSAALEVGGEWLLFGVHALSAWISGGADALDVSAGADPWWLRASAAVADEILLFGGALTVSPSVRAERIGPFTTFSPKLGATAFLPLGLEVRANAGQAHRAPSFQELYVHQGTLFYNEALEPERGLFADVGVALRAGEVRASATAFHTRYENLIVYEYFPPLLARPYNIATAVAQGLEVDASARPAPWLALEGSWTLTDTANLRDDPRYKGKPLPYRPRHRAVARVSAGPRWLRLRAEVDFQSAQLVNRTATVELPARAFVNAGATATVRSAPEVTLGLDLKNALDARSFDYVGYPLPGRALYATLSFAIDRSQGDRHR